MPERIIVFARPGDVEIFIPLVLQYAEDQFKEAFMKRAVCASVVALAMVFTAFVVWAVEFSSDVVSIQAGNTMTSKIFLKDKKVRMENPAQPGFTIMRGDKDVVWVVMPAQKMYMEMKVDPAKKPKVEEKVQGEVSRKLIGPETVDNHPTQKYEVTYTSGGKTEKMYQWMATDIKFPIKTAAIDGSWSNEYKNIKMGGQAESLFEVPSGYTKTSMPAMPGMPKAR